VLAETLVGWAIDLFTKIISQIILDTLKVLQMSLPEATEARRKELLSICKPLAKQQGG
jgi:hypothetical protein